MKIKDILSVTAGVAGTLNPALGAVISLVNQHLPSGKRLPAESTGSQVAERIESLPQATKAAVLESEIDLEKTRVESWRDIQKVHAETDASGASTRPAIAMLMAWAVVLSVVPICWSLTFSIITSNDPLQSTGDNYLMILALIGTPTILLRAYFGMRTAEKKSRYAASVGQAVNPVGILSSLFVGKK